MAASSVASLVVSMELSMAKFSNDMHKVSTQTTQAMNSIQKGANLARTAMGLLGVGLSVGAITSWARGVVSAAEALGDLADSTGSSVEDLSKLSNQAKVAGGNFDDFEGALLKFTAKIGDTQDVTSNFAIALKNLGVTAQDPATALQQVVMGLDKFANGATKAAYAKEIFGKAGAKFLATLADMAKLQDVSATVTTKQAEEAEKLAQSLRQLTTEASLFRDILLSGVIPQLLELVKAFNSARTAGAAGFFAGLGITEADRSNLQGAIAETISSIDELQKKKAAFENQGIVVKLFSTDDIAIVNGQIAVATQRLAQLQAQVKAIPGATAGGAKPMLPKLPGKGGGGAAGPKDSITDYVDEIDKLNNAMNRMASGSGAAVHMDAALEKIGHDLRAGVLMTNASIDAYLSAATALDKLTQEYKDWDEAMRLAESQAAKEQQQLKAFEDAQKSTAKSIDEFVRAINEQTDTMFMSNEAAEKYIALAKLQREYNEGLIPSVEALAAAQEAVGGALDRRNAAAAIRASIEEQKRYAEEIRSIFTNNIADGLTDVVMGTKSVSDAFKNMERNIVGSLSRIASQRIAESIFGGATAGGGGIFGSLFGGSNGGNSFNTMGMSGGLDSFLFSLFGGAAGGGSLAANQPKFVGERGPELFVPQSAGTVIPNDVLTARRAQQSVINISVNVDGATTRATADQVAVRTGIAVRRAMARNT